MATHSDLSAFSALSRFERIGGESGNATLVATAAILTKLDESFDSN